MMAISTGITMPRPQKTKPLRPTGQATWNSAERKCATKLAFYAELEKYSAIGNSPAQCAQRNALCEVWRDLFNIVYCDGKRSKVLDQGMKLRLIKVGRGLFYVYWLGH
jgi:hypothetical protein